LKSTSITILAALATLTVALADNTSANIPIAPPPIDLSLASTAVIEDKWTLFWSEEFTQEELDTSKWTLCARHEYDWCNTMSDDSRLLKIEDGILSLRGIVNSASEENAPPYLSSGIETRGKFSFLHGKVQIRARFISAQGAWPALWMMGEKGGWPEKGEIDLMEHINFDDRVHQTVHSPYTNNADHTNKPPKNRTTQIEKDQWNTYGCEWGPNEIIFTVNGRHTLTYPRIPEAGEGQWPFQQPFYLILSMQIGGDWVNQAGPTIPSQYPANMEIDYVRVFRK
jgi:beta-glucanase (GH16 family)